MIESIKLLFNKFFPIFLKVWPFLAIIIGFGTLIFGVWLTDPFYKDLITETGKAILVGGVLGSILQSFRFVGIFKDELSNILNKSSLMDSIKKEISSIVESPKLRATIGEEMSATFLEPKFLTRRDDLPTLWKNISTTMYGNKFPTISDELHNTIYRAYLPTEKNYYYSKYDRKLTVDWFQNKRDDNLNLETIDELEIHIQPSRDTEEIKYNHSFEAIIGHRGRETTHEVDSLTIDGNDYKDVYQENQFSRLGKDMILKSYEIPLKGSSTYIVKRIVKGVFSLYEEPVWFYAANTFVKAITLHVRCIPNDLIVKFDELGTLNKFDDIGFSAAHQTHKRDLSMEYKGLIFPRQGYVLSYVAAP
jgi:hypothetical protein